MINISTLTSIAKKVSLYQLREDREGAIVKLRDENYLYSTRKFEFISCMSIYAINQREVISARKKKMEQVQHSVDRNPYIRRIEAPYTPSVPCQYHPPSQTHNQISIIIPPEEEEDEVSKPMTEKQLIDSVNKELVSLCDSHKKCQKHLTTHFIFQYN